MRKAEVFALKVLWSGSLRQKKNSREASLLAYLVIVKFQQIECVSEWHFVTASMNMSFSDTEFVAASEAGDSEGDVDFYLDRCDFLI